MNLIGRETEFKKVESVLSAGLHLLIEGPVGVGKTFLAGAVCESLGKSFIRIDGDNRFSERKLAGWFDPPLLVQKGYSRESFVPGPLVQAMESGSLLFINELNRLPEGVQNVLLPAIDEGRIDIPQLGLCVAKPGFQVIATQNPREFVATTHLSEALLDRFEWIYLDYLENEIEERILLDQVSSLEKEEASLLVHLIHQTRNDDRVLRGASTRAAVHCAKLVLNHRHLKLKERVLESALLCFPTRIELQAEVLQSKTLTEKFKELILEWIELDFQKKKK
ncbi:MAG: hypothetical protein CL678_04200 [Bdellovibrionaceae bacterium]|nr:hypothetical protein [Pseudobdellovibrionaceae bacterium]|tara:strand:+ start:643 stop:1479 length:837 start_codon:yes stop_codon:yes gene_type:complete